MKDDISSLPIPHSAKHYARRHGLKSMRRQPVDYRRMVADLVNKGRQQMKNRDAGQQARLTVKETAEHVVSALLEASFDPKKYINTTLSDPYVFGRSVISALATHRVVHDAAWDPTNGYINWALKNGYSPATAAEHWIELTDLAEVHAWMSPELIDEMGYMPRILAWFIDRYRGRFESYGEFASAWLHSKGDDIPYWAAGIEDLKKLGQLITETENYEVIELPDAFYFFR